MNICGIVAEYNPFHNGHKLQIEKTRAQGATHIVCVMSGCFVQRGAISVMDKWQRAKQAIENGADLVVALPVIHSLSAANTFAKAGVYILNQLNVSSISFGSECGDIDLLKRTANQTILACNSPEMSKQLEMGVSYPTALHKAVTILFGENEILNGANNTLGIEYINAIQGYRYNINPITVNREQADHNKMVHGENIASATYIRHLLAEENYTKASRFVPYILENSFVFESDIEMMLLYKLKTMKTEDFLVLPDVIEGLHNRLYKAAQHATSMEQFYREVKTKRYTMSRIRRIAYCALLGITAKLQQLPPQYIQVLASNKRGYEILANVNSKKTAIIPIETKFKSLYDKKPNGIDIDILATDIFSLALKLPSGHADMGRDFTTSPIK